MAAVQDKSRPGSWIVHHSVDGKKVSVRVSGVTSKQGAERKATQQFAEKRAGIAPTLPAGLTVGHVLDEALADSTRHNRPRTVRGDHRAADHLRRLIGDVRCARVTIALMERYQEARKAEGAAPKTVNLETDFLRHGWNVAARKGLFGDAPPKNPVRGLERLKVAKFNPRIYSEAEWGEIIAAARDPENGFDPRIPALITLAFRRGLTKQDLGELEQSMIRIWRTAEGWRGEIQIPEGKRSPGTIPLDEDSVAGLRALPPAIGKVFPFGWLARDGSCPPVRRLAKITGYPLRMHGLRHNAVTNLVAGAGVAVAQTIARHRDVRTTLGYTHLSAAQIADAAAEADRKQKAR